MLALLRGGLALVQDIFFLHDPNVGVTYDLFFLIGGILFILTAYTARSSRSH